ncbi:MAG: thioesterase family protein [Paracoccus sp. (in: a-proteobacteria)]|uniref:thioesterase family protein n=1 Tax=Paracoccus sp. TaxID=267 RepID=UPI0026DFD90B|nr:thioesterase family protein [Paracoccus sp. (in: a-proteobacteria)]MDO5622518.1 thioesterase family protein [Paracoccus sp. (in: a-proteobacteria)]
MKPGLEIGATHQHRMTVLPNHTVRALFSEVGAFPDMPEVMATAYYTGLMEWACVELIKPFYEAGEQSLGTHVDFSHVAPTLPGQEVTVTARLEENDGKFLWFTVSAHDGVDLIGQGRHQRALIRDDRFNDRLAKKRAAAGLGA